MKHSKEPWRLGNGETVVSDDPVPEVSGADEVEYYGGNLVGESIAGRNAIRIVACVNSCEGIKTEWLEAVNLGKLLAQLARAKIDIDGKPHIDVEEFATLVDMARAAIICRGGLKRLR